ncbi:unnamed protein product [Discosporangium mesarthrocarpum]
MKNATHAAGAGGACPFHPVRPQEMLHRTKLTSLAAGENKRNKSKQSKAKQSKTRQDKMHGCVRAWQDSENSKAITKAAHHWGKVDVAEPKVRTMTQYCTRSGGASYVPDPYYGGPEGFEKVLDLLDDACEGLLDACRKESA